jgi:hypothetical protein
VRKDTCVLSLYLWLLDIVIREVVGRTNEYLAPEQLSIIAPEERFLKLKNL